MNGSENSYAGALFFALISLGAALKVDDLIIGGLIGAIGAILAAICLRRALNKAAQAAEEDHQRMEIQFQQLRSKIVEVSSTNVSAMNSLDEVTQLLRENIQLMNGKQSELDNLTKLVKNTESINSSVAVLEENSSALNAGLGKIYAAIQSKEKSTCAEEIKKLVETMETNKANLQAALKILNIIAQMIKNSPYEQELIKINTTIENISAHISNPSYTEDLAKINSTIENISAHISNPSYTDDLAKINTSIENVSAHISNPSYTDDLAKISTTIENLKISVDAAQKNISDMVKLNGTFSENFMTIFDDLLLEIAKLSDKIETLNASAENKSSLSAEDITLLKKIMAKINPK